MQLADELIDAVQIFGRQPPDPRAQLLDTGVTRSERTVDFALDQEAARQRRLLQAARLVQPLDRLWIFDDLCKLANVAPAW